MASARPLDHGDRANDVREREKSAGHKSDFHPSPTPCLLAGCGGWRSQSSSITETRAANVRSRCKGETNYTAELRSPPIHGRWFEWEQPVTELPWLSHCAGDLTSLMQLANGHIRFFVCCELLLAWPTMTNTIGRHSPLSTASKKKTYPVLKLKLMAGELKLEEC